MHNLNQQVPLIISLSVEPEQEEIVLKGIRENNSINLVNKRQVLMPKEKLNQLNLEDIMTEEIYLSKLITKDQ